MTPKPEELKVLIVDDDEMIVNSLEAIVKTQGFQVKAATDGNGAIAAINDWKPDAVLLDLIMPGPSGGEVLKHMESGPAAKIPVVVITAHGSDHPVVQMARKAPNVVQFLQKPIRGETVAGALHRVLKTDEAHG